MRTETDEIVRMREAFAWLSHDAVPQESCPAPDRLWAATRGELDPRAVREVIEHTATCGACAEAWRLAHRLVSELERPARRRPAVVPLAWRRLGAWATAAAAAVVLMVVGIQLRESPDATRSAPPTAGIRSLVEDNTILPRQDFTLRWQGPDGARYELSVMHDLRLVAEVDDLEVTEYRVPEDDLVDVPSGAQLLWQVEAIPPDGGSPLESDTFVVLLE